MTTEIIRPSSNYHWYDADGVPHHEAGPREARKLNLMPSVTTVMGVMKNPGLDIWKQNNLLLSALTFPDEEKEGVELDALAKRVVEDSRKQGSGAAIRGTAVHVGAEAILQQRAVKKNGDWRDFWSFHIDSERDRLYPATYKKAA